MPGKWIASDARKKIPVLYKKGLSVYAIARQLGIGSSSVSRHLKWNGVKTKSGQFKRRYALQLVSKALMEYSDGVLISDILAKYGISRSTLVAARKEAHVPIRKNGRKRKPVSHTGNKACSGKGGCGKEKPISCFTFSKQYQRYATVCKECRSRKEKEFRKTPEGKRASRISSLKRHGMSIEDFDAMLKKQNGGCGICGNTENKVRGNGLFVDHCHISGKIRGLLCHHCNAALGHFDDNVVNLRSAIAYLKANITVS